MEASQYKCPNCDAELVFDPSTQQLTCDFCRSEFTMDKIKEIYAGKTPETTEETTTTTEETTEGVVTSEAAPSTPTSIVTSSSETSSN